MKIVLRRGGNKFDKYFNKLTLYSYKMKLRNGKEYFYDSPIFEVKIDFDHASKMWLQNKIKIGNGCYEYK